MILNAELFDDKFDDDSVSSVISDVLSTLKGKILKIDVSHSSDATFGFGVFETGFMSLTLLLKEKKMLVDLYSSTGFETGKILENLLHYFIVSKWNWQTFDRKDIICALGE